EITDEHKKYCAEKTQEAVALYLKDCSEPQNKDRSANELRLVLEQHVAKKPIVVKIFRRHYTKCITRAFYWNYGDRIQINIAQGFEPSTVKYYLVRELFHLVIDKPEFRTTDAVGLIGNSFLRSSPDDTDLALGHPTIAE